MEHIVAVMMKNHSFGNSLEGLHDDPTNPPPFNVPAWSWPSFGGLNGSRALVRTNPSAGL